MAHGSSNSPTLYDITPAVDGDLGIWPGDTPVSREVLCDLSRGDSVTLSTLRATVHLGAHADGPNHYGIGGASIGQRSLHFYLGPCDVLRVNAKRGQRIQLEDVDAAIANLKSQKSESSLAPRVLIDTGTYPDAAHFNEDFAGLAPDLVDALHERGVMLIGTDAPSVDTFDSKDLPAHQRFLAHDMAILETLALRDVPIGRYELIALPLKLMGFDASPVRAVLRTM